MIQDEDAYDDHKSKFFQAKSKVFIEGETLGDIMEKSKEESYMNVDSEDSSRFRFKESNWQSKIIDKSKGFWRQFIDKYIKNNHTFHEKLRLKPKTSLMFEGGKTFMENIRNSIINFQAQSPPRMPSSSQHYDIQNQADQNFGITSNFNDPSVDKLSFSFHPNFS